jgi:cell division protein FtsI/penicillin-binding protein 2
MKAPRLFFVSFIVLPLLASSLTLRAQGSDLFSQTASAELTRQFGGRDLSWLLLDRSGRMLAMNWEDANLTIAPGSLLKPFIAVAYGEQHGFVYPHVTCTGAQGRCWLPRGHGTIGLEKAIAGSCNAYFLALADGLDPDRADATFSRFGLNGPPKNADPEILVGLKDQWRETPLSLARAYLELVTDAPEPVRQRILSGMRSAAESGTAREVNIALGNPGAMAKTGTAICSHHPRAAVDGFAIVLFPASQPRLLLLVRMHGVAGARAAAEAGAMLHAIGMGAR